MIKHSCQDQINTRAFEEIENLECLKTQDVKSQIIPGDEVAPKIEEGSNRKAFLFDNNFNIEDYFKEPVGEVSEASGQAEVTMPSKKGSEALKEALEIVMNYEAFDKTCCDEHVEAYCGLAWWWYDESCRGRRKRNRGAYGIKGLLADSRKK
eukprot:GHVP01004119.1.p1 GENE.GHVP01004119.1~~GHVP01004119.1.p1  ORF type:complete len:152 (+),score=31.92 GHVP01004119.1:92-547(+)